MKIIKLFLIAVSLASVAAQAQADAYEQDRQAMRAILADVEKALNDQDFDAALKHIHQDAVITYYNAEVTKGHKEASDYYERMIKGAAAVVKEFSTKGDVSAPAVIHGNTAIAYGTTVENYKLAAGMEFTLNGRWSATLLKSGTQWKIVALHFSSNLFDNPLLNNAGRTTWIAGVIAFIVGALLMLLVVRLRTKKA